MVIGLFGGTFDPIHFGHLNLAFEMMERHHLDGIWFIPAYRSPFKPGKTPAEAHYRLEMLRLAIEDIPQFQIVDLELKKEAPSYTVDTLRELVHLNPGVSFRLILGSDTAKEFPQWKEPDEIKALAPPLFGRRLCSEEGERMKVMEISSTEIRSRLKKGLYCGHLLPAKVLDYIIKNHLYLNVHET
jgi:nicotinate-nucleotide adenylyltransferase